MATGAFGRRPRLNNNSNQAAIQALYKQAQDAEWTAMQDAWKNGGMIDGQPVTDQMILDYMTKRRDEIGAPTGGEAPDPAYTQWSNNVSQLKFSIAESKVGVQFKEGKMSAAQVATFYKDQLSNLPQDSEIYRTVAGKAADWAKSANDAASGSASASVMKALQARIKNDQAAGKAFLDMQAVVDNYAKSKGWGTALGTYQVTQLEDALKSGAIVDPQTGQAITLDAWKAGMLSSYNAYGDAADAYKQGGDPQTAETYLGYQRTLSTSYIMTSNTFDARETYQVARDQFKNDLAAANGNPYAIDAANANYKKALQGILGQAQAAGLSETGGADPAFTGAITNEINTIDGVTGPNGKALGPTWADITAGEGSTDANETAGEIAKLNSDKVKMANGTAFYGQNTPTGAYGVRDMSEVDGATFAQDGTVILPDSYTKTTVSIGGNKVEVVMDGQPIYKTVLVDSKGDALSDAQIAKLGGVQAAISSGAATVYKDKGLTVIGYTYFDPTTGAGKPIGYATIGPNGQKIYSTASPISGTMTTDGYVVVGGTGNVTGTVAKGNAINYDPTSTATVTRIVAPGATPTAPDQFVGSATLDPSRPPEQSVSVTSNNAAKFASMTGATQYGLGSATPAAAPQQTYSPSQGWLTPGETTGIAPALRSAPVAATALGVGSQIKTTLPTPTITLPHYPGMPDPSRNPGTSLSPGQGLGAPTPFISLPTPPGLTPPVLTDPSRNPFASLPVLPGPTPTKTPGGLGKTQKAF